MLRAEVWPLALGPGRGPQEGDKSPRKRLWWAGHPHRPTAVCWARWSVGASLRSTLGGRPCAGPHGASARRVVKEEISADNARLPCFNGRVVSWVSLGAVAGAPAGVGVGVGVGLRLAECVRLVACAPGTSEPHCLRSWSWRRACTRTWALRPPTATPTCPRRSSGWGASGTPGPPLSSKNSGGPCLPGGGQLSRWVEPGSRQAGGRQGPQRAPVAQRSSWHSPNVASSRDGMDNETGTESMVSHRRERARRRNREEGNRPHPPPQTPEHTQVPAAHEFLPRPVGSLGRGPRPNVSRI